MFLIVIDAGSKWIEAFPMSTATSKATIQCLRTLFAQFGLPDILVSDNGTSFTSSKFQEFLATNGIEHWKSAPYHPSSNGLAEKAVQIVKQGLKRMKDGSVMTGYHESYSLIVLPHIVRLVYHQHNC